MMASSKYILLSLSLVLFIQCSENVAGNKSSHAEIQSDVANKTNASDLLSPPAWAADATIYEVNLRQYSEEATFKSFLPQIPRLKDMGAVSYTHLTLPTKRIV